MRRRIATAAWVAVRAALLCLTACGPNVDRLVDDLADPQRREAAAQGLLLAKEFAVKPLIEALDEPHPSATRVALVEVAAGLMSRVDDERLPAALGSLLEEDADPKVRASIAHYAAVHRRSELIDALLSALDDDAGEVRYEALLALNGMSGRLSESQAAVFEARQSRFADDPHPGVQLEGLIKVEEQVATLLGEAERAVLEARMDEAESLYVGAVARFPGSRRARYAEGRFYYDNGEPEKGMGRLRAGGMLLDVPRLPGPPDIDGRLDDDAWSAAARADSFFQLSTQHAAALPTQNRTTMWLGWTGEALFIGFRGHDAHPDSLVARFTDVEAADRTNGQTLSESIWRDDVIELFIDADFDHKDYAHIGINSNGVRVDHWIRGVREEVFMSEQGWSEEAWRAHDAVAAHVGDDHWSVEYRLDFGSDEFPRPSAGVVWGFNLVRVFRGAEYSQWVRTYPDGHSPDDFGLLRFAGR